MSWNSVAHRRAYTQVFRHWFEASHFSIFKTSWIDVCSDFELPWDIVLVHGVSVVVSITLENTAQWCATYEAPIRRNWLTRQLWGSEMIVYLSIFQILVCSLCYTHLSERSSLLLALLHYWCPCVVQDGFSPRMFIIPVTGDIASFRLLFSTHTASFIRCLGTGTGVACPRPIFFISGGFFL